MLVTYPALFYYDDTDGAEATYFVHFPDFEFSATQGEGISEALAMGSEWLGITVADLIENDEDLPQPSDINSLSLIDNDPFKDDEDFVSTYDLDKSFISMVSVGWGKSPSLSIKSATVIPNHSEPIARASEIPSPCVAEYSKSGKWTK